MHCASSCKKGFIVKNQGCFMAPQKKMKCQPTPVFLPGESHGQRGLAGTVHGVSGSWTQLSDFHFTSEEDELSDILKTIRTSYFSILLLPRQCDILSLSSFWTLLHSSPEDCFSVFFFFLGVCISQVLRKNRTKNRTTVFLVSSAGKRTCLQCRRPWFNTWVENIP